VTTLETSADWLNKITIEFEEDDEGSKLTFTWDEKDPELQLWTELGEKKQQEFVLSALRRSCGLTTEENFG
jgi:hypothetical protein